MIIKEYNQSIQQKHMHMQQIKKPHKKQKIKCNNIIKKYKMINFDCVTQENIKKQNLYWS